jgi:hypothetical protein
MAQTILSRQGARHTHIPAEKARPSYHPSRSSKSSNYIDASTLYHALCLQIPYKLSHRTMAFQPVHRHCNTIRHGLILKSGLIARCGAVISPYLSPILVPILQRVFRPQLHQLASQLPRRGRKWQCRAVQ